MDLWQVTIACGSEEEATVVADVLLTARLAACVQTIGPVTSRYWWQGSIETAAEWLCVVKTRADLAEQVGAAVRAVHSYDTPEIAAVPIVGGDEAYLDWIAGEASGGRVA